MDVEDWYHSCPHGWLFLWFSIHTPIYSLPVDIEMKLSSLNSTFRRLSKLKKFLSGIPCLDIVFSLITPALPVLYFISNPIYFQGQQDCPRWVGPAIYFRNDNVIYPEVFSPSYTKDHRSETPVPQRWLVSRKVINKVFWSRVYPFSFLWEDFL